jgi:hypothetical protein
MVVNARHGHGPQRAAGALVPKLTQTQLESTFLWAEPCDCLTKQRAHGDYCDKP